MSHRADRFDLAPLLLTAGDGRTLERDVAFDALELGGERYAVEPAVVPVRLDVSRTNNGGYALRLRFEATVVGPCMRCLEPSRTTLAVDAREVDQPDADSEELDSPYLEEEVLDLAAWARDALSLSLPPQLLCREECAGLCAECGENLNEAPDHRHERPPDPRWAKLRELEL